MYIYLYDNGTWASGAYVMFILHFLANEKHSRTSPGVQNNSDPSDVHDRADEGSVPSIVYYVFRYMTVI